MKKNYPHAVGITCCIFFAVSGYIWSTSLIQSLFAFRSPLSNFSISPGELTGPSISQRVVIILVDALRTDTAFNSEIMPTINQLKEQGAWGIMHSQPPSYSEPGWTTLLTGAWPDISDGPPINLDYELIHTFTQDDIISSAHRQGYETAVSGYYWFEKLIPQGSVDHYYYTQGEDDLADQQVVEAAIPWLGNLEINLILIHLDQVDFAGHHEGGPIGGNWNKAARRADSLISRIVNQMDLEKSILLIISDHGQVNSGGHGGPETVNLLEPYIFVGQGIIPGNFPDIQMVDIAPTISIILGLNIPAANQGQPLLNRFDLSAEKTTVVQDALSRQQELLLITYRNSLVQHKPVLLTFLHRLNLQYSIDQIRNLRLGLEVLERIIFVVIIICFLYYFALRNFSIKKVIPYVLFGLLYILLFHLFYAIIGKHPYSLSWITSQYQFLIVISSTVFFAFITCWIIFIVAMKSITRSPLESSQQLLYLTLTIILVTGLPVYFSYIANGFIISWTLPEMLGLYMAFLGLIQWILISIMGIVFTGLSIPMGLTFRRLRGVKWIEN
jgi:hypothetical protein